MSHGLDTLLGDRRFMDRSRWISVTATVIGVMLILAGEREPLRETFDAVQGAAVPANWAETARRDGSGAVSQILTGARLARAVDAKTLTLVRHGLRSLGRLGLYPRGYEPPR